VGLAPVLFLSIKTLMFDTNLVIGGIPSPSPFPDCIGTEYSLLEGEGK